MGEILSQSEIDELLKSLASGGSAAVKVEEPKRTARDYDFARPSKFSKEQLRSLEMIFDNYARVLSSFLSAFLRTTTHVEVVSAEQATYSEFNNALTNPCILSILEFTPMKGSVVLELSANLGYSIIDRILGGPGSVIMKMRDFSEIEKILLERVITQMISFIAEPWENVGAIKPRLEKLETNAQFAQIIAPNEMTALVTLSMKLGSVEGLMNVCIPHITIEPVMERLNTKFWFSTVNEEPDENHARELEAQLETAKVAVSAIIGRTRISVGDFVHLQPGDVIPLDSYINSDMQIMVGSLLKFHAKPGISRGKNAVQITSLVEKEG